MEQQSLYLAILALIEEGVTRLRPLELSPVNGEFWGATSRQSFHAAAACDGQHVELLLLEEIADHARLRGVLQSSTDRRDCEVLWELQHDSLTRWCAGAHDPDLIVLKIIPEPDEEEYGPPEYQRRAA
ncbi:MAG: pyridoxamine 5'-phosphate oxidase family protein [Armatimonadota bacterium]